MTLEEFRAQMLEHALGSAKVLCEVTMDSVTDTSIKLEPEQVRKNVATILVTLTETESFIKAFNQNNKNNCSDSNI